MTNQKSLVVLRDPNGFMCLFCPRTKKVIMRHKSLDVEFHQKKQSIFAKVLRKSKKYDRRVNPNYPSFTREITAPVGKIYSWKGNTLHFTDLVQRKFYGEYLAPENNSQETLKGKVSSFPHLPF